MYLHMIGIPILGLALLWSIRLTFGVRRGTRDDVLSLALTIAAWVLILLGLALVLPMPITLIGLIVAPMVLQRNREAELRNLIWTLSVGMQHGVPLYRAVQSYAAGRLDESGRRAARLAEFLERGVPLTIALRHSGHVLPTDVELALTLDIADDQQGILLRHAAGRGMQMAGTYNQLYATGLYLTIGLAAILGLLAYFHITIAPTFRAIVSDFGTDISLAGNIVDGLSGFLRSHIYWLILAGIGAVLLMLYFALRYAGVPALDLPLISHFRRRVETAMLLDTLAFAADHDIPLPKAVRAVAKRFPRAGTRHRLARAAKRIDNGQHWTDALRAARVLKSSDKIVLEAAERAGNLPWALRQLSEIIHRRVADRVNVIARLSLPVIVLLLALPVALIAITVFAPLAQLIEALAQ